ncbi:Putative flippase GtrA (transmembrane translocase of bactoprenol-linked glucose) [Lentzea albidocapillata]|uniref:Putative flippase GtrA (Transmembrane translocase of bactoprenol-linked glucose) n=2 Tax=Lentzea albidocapillata TaxID=40571 RepID=A0A1W2B7Z8_9PSEU|nr:GtrA family protein [Lentzea albidocapillata]SMC68822.1 Putative flippase GtrA (transmembrane translocase of bactoprenol-linked glucose) [Lentzea albidocapillata]
MSRLPEPVQFLMHKHRELLRFALVGGTTFVIDNGVWYALKLTVLTDKVVTAKVIGVLVAIIASYVLSREWSFHTRGGRERHHEAALFFLVSGVAVGINIAPLWLSRHLFGLQAPFVSVMTEEIADFVSGSILGMLLATGFKFWAMRRWVFPDAGARPDRRVHPISVDSSRVPSRNSGLAVPGADSVDRAEAS